jgi:hypothetical protein
MTNSEYAKGLLSLGCRDYLASRFLLNNNYILQGTVLASSAVEKYLKAGLALNGKRLNKHHLDSLGQFKSLYSQTPYHMMFDVLDPVFLAILGKAYKYRYYDEKTVTKPDTIGFLVNQFLGTLDFTILKLDSLFVITSEKDGVTISQDTQLKRAAKSGLPDLWLNNYVLNKIDKVEFMNRKSKAFGLHITPLNFGEELEITGHDVVGPYEGKMWTVTLNLTPKEEL